MRIITRSDVERLLPVGACIAVMRGAMQATSRRQVTLPLRQYLAIPGAPGRLALMPGTLGDPACFGIKLVCKYDRPHGDPLGSHVGMMLLFDSNRGVPLAMIEGSALTAIRTSAASALATDVLARRDASRLAVLGTREQALRHVAAMRAVRAIDAVAIWGRDMARAEALAAHVTTDTGITVTALASVAAAVAGADIICTTSAAKTPILAGASLAPGMHINLVGAATADAAEIDSAGVRRGRFYVDYREAALAAAGELLGAMRDGVVGAEHIVGEIGEVIDGSVAGRTGDADITICKSLGVAAQDLAAAHALWVWAEADGSGIEVDLMA